MFDCNLGAIQTGIQRGKHKRKTKLNIKFIDDFIIFKYIFCIILM